ncbi:MAG: hypothetical protein K8F91_16235 [Candidatus Obscuribacterales bacterium]|nr:hypothetical protein [Candidatus Obscuribacterales bacterium]
MKSNQFVALTLTALFTLLSAGQAQAQGQREEGRAEDPVAIYKEAGINAEQEGRIRKLAKDFEMAQRVRFKTVTNYVKEMSALQMQPDPSEDEVLAKQQQLNEMTATMANERLKLMLKIRSILTAEQKQKLVSLIREKAEAVRGKAERGGQSSQ